MALKQRAELSALLDIINPQQTAEAVKAARQCVYFSVP